ncbi:molybdenum ABC transporter permease [[Bacillus] enclensis]|uniref:Molybdenum transport system permease n=1 Tax=[Bacillus] enclensis TaxID=1402860 RepID=A0A0V8HQ01_9BACI|nr:molybdate ABC transporter permease subunit [[Bacillus] enclensis]KSU64654.1 molybdenum ABC transporter permease [[Bacillus] enclensis]SCB77793.1 molybdate transport system permease protein [[Bacillus] enclensis]
MESFWFPIKLSLLVAGASTIFTFIVSVLLSHKYSRINFRGKTFLETLFILPLVLPPSVIGFILLIMFGINSPIGRGIEKVMGETILFTPYAAIVAAVVVAFPLMYQSAKAGFLSIDGDIEAASRVDGASEAKVLMYVSIPLASRSLLTGAILSFTRALGEFGATLMFAGNIPGKTKTISTAIYVAIESGEDSLAWKYVGISIAISFIFLFFVNRINGRP